MKKTILYTYLIFIGSVWLHAEDSSARTDAVQTTAVANSIQTQEVQSGKGTHYGEFTEVPINTVEPQGWLLEFLKRQNTGLTGNHNALSYPYDTCLWAGFIPRKGDHGKDWWRYEQAAYLSDGIIRLGYLLKDAELVKTAEDGVKYILANPMKNDRLGHPFFESQWPMAVYFRVLQAEYSATHDPKLLEAMRKHYNSYGLKELNAQTRNIVNIEGMLWTYGMTGDANLLTLAEQAYLAGGDDMPLKRCASPDKVVIHGVTHMEEAKLPAILYMYTGKKPYLDAAVNAFSKLERDHMQPDGVPSSNEFLAGRDPIQSHETCDISDYTWSIGYLLMASGNAGWADRLERAVFNAGPGCVSKDFKNFQYFSSVNQVIATGKSDHNKDHHGSTWMAYWPCNEVECCAGNVNRFMPNYAARMWMRDKDQGLVAALYGPSKITLPESDREKSLTVTEETEYPFGDKITFKFKTRRSVSMPFTFRVPQWCADPQVRVNGQPCNLKLEQGKFSTINRSFADGDKVELTLPSTANLVKWDDYGVAVFKGPLLFAYPVKEQVAEDTNTYANLRGKKSPDPVKFPALDITPAADWNYALAAQTSSDLQVRMTQSTGYPFDPGSSPVVIDVPAQKVKDWGLVENRYTPPLPKRNSYACEGSVDKITLVPYGSTRLRLGVFPTASVSGSAAAR